MDLHSYAKHRAVKKWSMDQKRSLIDARIRNEDLFQMYPGASRLPWRRVLNEAHLTDYNEGFVKKQWSCIISKYIEYKSDHSNGIEPLSAETVRKITKEWEFFERIHAYMTRKTTNLHSYALNSAKSDSNIATKPTAAPAKAAKLNQLERCDRPSSHEKETKHTHASDAVFKTNDTNNDVNVDATITIQSTESEIKKEPAEGISIAKQLQMDLRAFLDNHDYDTKRVRTSNQNLNSTEKPVILISSPSEQMQMSECIVGNGKEKCKFNNYNRKTNIHLRKSPEVTSSSSLDGIEIYSATMHKSAQKPANTSTQQKVMKSPKKQLSEREKYYRHKRRFNRRLEHRFDAVLNVAAQIAKASYPSIDVSSLLKHTTNAVRNTCNGLLTSDEDMTSTSDTEICDKNDTQTKTSLAH